HQAALRTRHGGRAHRSLRRTGAGAGAREQGLRLDAREAGGGIMSTTPQFDIRDQYAEKYGFHDEEQSFFKSRKGLDRELVAQISEMKGEPKWMLDYRLKALGIFEKKPMPNWGADLSDIDFQDIYYYVKPTSEEARS